MSDCKLTDAELKRAYAGVILEGNESEFAKLWQKHFPGWSLKIPFLSSLTEEVKRDFRQWAKDKPGWF